MLQGHKVKNAKTKLVQALRTVPAGVRVILSGTPIQNNLGEMHALYDFACEVCTLPPLKAVFPQSTLLWFNSRLEMYSNSQHTSATCMMTHYLCCSRACWVMPGTSRSTSRAPSRPATTGMP